VGKLKLLMKIYSVFVCTVHADENGGVVLHLLKNAEMQTTKW